MSWTWMQSKVGTFGGVRRLTCVRGQGDDNGRVIAIASGMARSHSLLVYPGVGSSDHYASSAHM